MTVRGALLSPGGSAGRFDTGGLLPVLSRQEAGASLV
jgi:hypothetical protein